MNELRPVELDLDMEKSVYGPGWASMYEVEDGSAVPPGLDLLYGLPVDVAARGFCAIEKPSDSDKCVIDGIGDLAFSPPASATPSHHLVYAISTSPDVSAIDRFGNYELVNLHVTPPTSTSSRLKAFFLSATNTFAENAPHSTMKHSPSQHPSSGTSSPASPSSSSLVSLDKTDTCTQKCSI